MHFFCCEKLGLNTFQKNQPLLALAVRVLTKSYSERSDFFLTISEIKENIVETNRTKAIRRKARNNKTL